MRNAGAIVIAVALGWAGPALADGGEIALEFGSSSGGTTDGYDGRHLAVSAELPMPGDFRLGLAANSDTYLSPGDEVYTTAMGIAPGWQVNDSLRAGAFYERSRKISTTAVDQLDLYGLEAGYRPGGPVALSAYWSRYQGGDWGDAPSANYGFSVETSLGRTYTAHAFIQRDTFDGGWWQDSGVGADHQIDGSGIGLSMVYTERRASSGADPMRIFFFGGTIAVGDQTAPAREFRARHCVICAMPL